MMKIKNSLILPIIILLVLSFTPFLYTRGTTEIEPKFSITILCPNTSPQRNSIANLMAEQLPKIGIGVDYVDLTSWSEIYPRTWGYSDTPPIPSYSAGGYDVLIMGQSFNLDWNPGDIFSTSEWSPSGDNHYQYSNTSLDAAYSNYNDAYLLSERVAYAEEMQAILHDDLPALPIYYGRDICFAGTNITSLDLTLWSSNGQGMDDWELVPGVTDLRIATPTNFSDSHIYSRLTPKFTDWDATSYYGLLKREVNTGPYWPMDPNFALTYDTADGLTWTVELDTDAKWSDGTSITTDDILFSYTSILSPEIESPLYSLYSTYLDNSSIIAVDSDTVQFTLKEQYNFAENLLALSLIPKHIWEPIPMEQWDSKYAYWMVNDPSMLVGCGSYKFKDWDATNGIIHLTYNSYFDSPGPNTPQDVYFEYYSDYNDAKTEFVAGHIDFLDSRYYPAGGDKDWISGISSSMRQVTDFSLEEISINMQHPYFGTGESCPIAGTESAKHVRKAINYIIPKDSIIENILEGIGTPGVNPMPDKCIGFDTTLQEYEYSIETAINHMKLAGFDFPNTMALGESCLIFILGLGSLIGACQVFLMKRKK